MGATTFPNTTNAGIPYDKFCCSGKYQIVTFLAIFVTLEN